MNEIPEYACPKLVKPNKRKKQEWQWCYECHTWEVHEDGICPFCAMIAKAGPDELAEIKRIWPNHFTHRQTIPQGNECADCILFQSIQTAKRGNTQKENRK